MPTITLNRKVLDALIGKKLSPEELKDRIAMIGTDLESLDDKEVVVEVFPNRPDMLSEQGFGRALRSFLGLSPGLHEYPVKKSGYKVVVDSSVTMRPYTACAIVKNLTFTDERIKEIMQVQEKLATTHGRNRKKSAYGIYPLAHITFPITYIAKDPDKIKFKPLGFDQLLAASEVLLVHPKAKEYNHLTVGWKKYPFFIDAKDNVMCMLPFTNSQDTGKVDINTREVFIECSGIDLANVSVALNILVTMLADMGGEIYSLDVMYGNKKITTPNLTPLSMNFDIAYANKILGLDLKQTDAKKYLEMMGYSVKGKDVLVPAYRADILHPRDLVEDIAIAYGYEHIPEEIPVIATIAQEDPFDVFKQKIGNLLVGYGMYEVSNFHLIDTAAQTTQMQVPSAVLEILDPVSIDYNSLRSWILPCLLQTLRQNKQYEFPQKFFEVGVIFKKDVTKYALADEAVRLGVVVCHQKASFTEARQILDYILRMLEIEYTVVESELGCFLPGRVGRVIVKDADASIKVAYIGEIHPQVLQNFGLEMPVAAVELNLTELWKVVGKRL
ncbi:MAG: phenylalanine--tRNA ligase subunit beta [Nanoarchaeota archaeon]|mgnify:CR=1 FL=1